MFNVVGFVFFSFVFVFALVIFFLVFVFKFLRISMNFGILPEILMMEIPFVIMPFTVFSVTWTKQLHIPKVV